MKTHKEPMFGNFARVLLGTALDRSHHMNS